MGKFKVITRGLGSSQSGKVVVGVIVVINLSEKLLILEIFRKVSRSRYQFAYQ